MGMDEFDTVFSLDTVNMEYVSKPKQTLKLSVFGSIACNIFYGSNSLFHPLGNSCYKQKYKILLL